MLKKTVYLHIIFLFFLFTFIVNAGEVRTWTATNGKKVEAELIGISEDGKTILLREPNGTENKGALIKLSKADREYVQKQKDTVAVLVDTYKSPFKNIREAVEKKGTIQDIEYFIEKGANLNTKDKFGTPLLNQAAFYDNDVEVVRLLIEKGAKYTRDKSGRTPLHEARNVEVVRLLIEKGAKYTRDKSGCTPLHGAATRGNVEVAKLLISSGANVNARDTIGWTPLHFAENVEVAKLLISSGANVNARGIAGVTPLHFASIGSNVEVVKLLVSSGANVNARDIAGSTPLEYAKNVGHLGVANYLAGLTNEPIRSSNTSTPPSSNTSTSSTATSSTSTTSKPEPRSATAITSSTSSSPKPEKPTCRSCFGTGKKTERCHSCKGSGQAPPSPLKSCLTCKGTGTVKMMTSSFTCGICQGTGGTPPAKCSYCSGKGTKDGTCSDCTGTGKKWY